MFEIQNSKKNMTLVVVGSSQTPTTTRVSTKSNVMASLH